MNPKKPKVDDYRFNIRLNEADPVAKRAAAILNAAGRRKGTIIANAVCLYEDMQKRAGENISISPAVPGGAGFDASPTNNHETASDDDAAVAKAIASTLGGFRAE